MSRRGGHVSASFRGRQAGGIGSGTGGGIIGRQGSSSASTRAPMNSSSSNGSGGAVGGPLSMGTGPRAPQLNDPSKRMSDFWSQDDKCPQCQTDRYLNPKLRLLISPCYHKMCESCIDRIFSLGPAPCPECGKTCRKNQFGGQRFQDLQVEREVDIRSRIGKLFNKREEDFDDLKDYNDYLEEVESLTFNLINGINLEVTNARIQTYESANRSSIASNVKSAAAESEAARSREEQEKMYRKARATRRREREEREKAEKEQDEKDLVEALAGRGGFEVETVMKRREENAKRREEAREREERAEEEAEKRREWAMGVSKPTGKRGNGKEDDERLPWSFEMALDFEGPLASLTDACDWFDVRHVPLELGGLPAPPGTVVGYDDPWITNKLQKDDIARLRAGGYDWGQSWSRALRYANEGLGLAPP